MYCIASNIVDAFEISLSMYLSIYLSIHPSIHPSKLSLRPKFVSLVLNSWQDVMQYMMPVRYNSLEERFISFIKLFGDTWSGLSAVVN